MFAARSEPKLCLRASSPHSTQPLSPAPIFRIPTTSLPNNQSIIDNRYLIIERRYFLSDNTISIEEPRVTNSGLSQGKFMRRLQVMRPLNACARDARSVGGSATPVRATGGGDRDGEGGVIGTRGEWRAVEILVPPIPPILFAVWSRLRIAIHFRNCSQPPAFFSLPLLRTEHTPVATTIPRAGRWGGGQGWRRRRRLSHARHLRPRRLRRRAGGLDPWPQVPHRRRGPDDPEVVRAQPRSQSAARGGLSGGRVRGGARQGVHP